MRWTLEKEMKDIEDFIYGPKVAPYSGWHDDHRQNDGTPAYMPAMQQVREEFVEMLMTIARAGLLNGSCLQLGLGPSKASHQVWRRVFSRVLTIDLAVCCRDSWISDGGDTHSQESINYASSHAPYNFLFIDAGHSHDDVVADYMNYRYMVRPGGLIAFHDALPRERYPEIKVHEFIKTLPVTILGDEVGTAVMEVK